MYFMKHTWYYMIGLIFYLNNTIIFISNFFKPLLMKCFLLFQISHKTAALRWKAIASLFDKLIYFLFWRYFLCSLCLYYNSIELNPLHKKAFANIIICCNYYSSNVELKVARFAAKLMGPCGHCVFTLLFLILRIRRSGNDVAGNLTSLMRPFGSKRQ